MPACTPIVRVMTSDPVRLSVDARLSDAVRILTCGRFHHLPIVEGRRLVGLMSASDIVGLSTELTAGDGGFTRTFLDGHYAIADLMRRELTTVSDRSTVAEAAAQLAAGGFHSLPVVSANYDLVGIVTTTDLVAHLLESEVTSSSPPATDAARLQALESVLKAAQHFLHSGLAPIEQSRLEKALESASDTQAA